MGLNLCIGISAKRSGLAVAALRCGRPCLEVDFPATSMGVEAIKSALDDYQQPIRLAVTGLEALDLALALGNAPDRETLVVPPGVTKDASDLALFASRIV